MRAAARAELLQLEPRRIVAAVLLARVISLAALGALERDHDAGRPYPFSPFSCVLKQARAWQRWFKTRVVRRPQRGRRTTMIPLFAYSVMEVTTPAPTVRPPSRMAKRSPSSIATGVISSTPICTLSPGITISVPSGSVMAPVTSVVRM